MADETLYAKVGAGVTAAVLTWMGFKRVTKAHSEDHGDDIETLKSEIVSLHQMVEDLRRSSKEKIDSVRIELSEVKLSVQEMQFDVEAKVRDTSRQTMRHLNTIENQLRELMALHENPQQPRDYNSGGGGTPGSV